MLRITVLGVEAFDETSQEFTTQGDVVLELEHSLVSLSKWESEFERPFLSNESKTSEELFDYIRCMALDPDVPGQTFHKLTEDNYKQIDAYINKKMTATWFSDVKPATRNQEVLTAELIYFWMISYKIPFECENWHLNRLFTLIRICDLKQGKPKKMSRNEIAQRNRELNEQRKKQLGTKG